MQGMCKAIYYLNINFVFFCPMVNYKELANLINQIKQYKTLVRDSPSCIIGNGQFIYVTVVLALWSIKQSLGMSVCDLSIR